MVMEIELDGDRLEVAALAMVIVGAVMIALVLLGMLAALLASFGHMFIQVLTDGSLVEILSIGGLVIGASLIGVGLLVGAILESIKEDCDGS